MIEKITDMLKFVSPVRVYLRSDSLVIQDYRPTWVMALCLPGGLGMAGLAIWLLVAFGTEAMFGVVVCGLFAVAGIFFALRQSIREVYRFDVATDSYRFVRRYVHRKEVIEGSIDQFTGAYVKTVTHDESESYHVVLRQEGMFLTGVGEQTLREETPIFNSFSNEAQIANAISSIVSVAKHQRSLKKG